MLVDGEAHPPEGLAALLAEEFGAEPAFLARLAMLHSSTVFTEAKGLDLREHLCRVFGVDGLVAALDQTKALAQETKKSVDSARKIAAVSDEEFAALVDLEARAAELTEAAETERAEAERRARGRPRGEHDTRARHDEWKAASARYEAALGEIAAAATALLGRDMPVATIAADLEAAETSELDALGRGPPATGRAHRAVAGHHGRLGRSRTCDRFCPVCRRPLDDADVEVARASHEAEVANLETELASLAETESDARRRGAATAQPPRERAAARSRAAPARRRGLGRSPRRRRWSASISRSRARPNGGQSSPKRGVAGLPANHPGSSWRR